MDILDENRLRLHIESFNPDVIIHTAALVNVDFCEEHEEEAYLANAILTKKISDICHEKNIMLIYISTDSVFDGTMLSLYNEQDNTNPLNIYAKTKLEGEHYVSQLPNSTLIRTNIYGYNIQNKQSIGEWMLNALLEGQTLNLFEDIFFSPILVNELTTIIDLIIEQKVFGLYHICSTGAISKYEFGIKLKEIFNIETGIINRSNSHKSNLRAIRPKNMGMDNTQIRKKLNIDITSPIQGLERFKELYNTQYPSMLKNFI